MTRFFTIISVLIILTVACSSDPKTGAVKNIAQLEEDLYAEQMIDREKGIELINAYVAYSKDFPQDTSNAMFLFKAGEIAMNLQLGEQAINFFKIASSSQENFRKEPECMFLAAFIYENQMNNLTQAENLYRLFLKEFPSHPLAKDAEASIKYLGKSPEELIKMFQEQNK